MSKIQESVHQRPWLWLGILVAALGAIGLMVLPANANHITDKPLSFNQAGLLPLAADDFSTVLEECDGVDTDTQDGWVFIHPPVNRGRFTHLDPVFSSGAQSHTFGGASDAVHSNSQGSRVTFVTPQGATLNSVTASGVPAGHDFFNLTHTCSKAGTEIDIAKTPDSGTLTVGNKVMWNIIVSDIADGVDAENVQVTDDLQPAGFDFEIVDQGLLPGGTGGSACSIDSVPDPNALSCSFAILSDAAAYQVTVRTVNKIPVGSDLCGTDILNEASATADNADSASDTGQQSVECGAIKVTKVVKVPQNGTQPLAGACFTLYDSDGPITPEMCTPANGMVCFDGLAINTTYQLKETTVPTGYNGADDQLVTTGGDASCPDTGDVITVEVENIPLTDLLIEVEAQVPGATNSSIDCGDIGNMPLGDPVSLDVDGLEPGTYVCTIVIDP